MNVHRIRTEIRMGKSIYDLPLRVTFHARVQSKPKWTHCSGYIALRHTVASVMLMLNVPDKYAQARGGWSTPSTMKNVYQHTIASKRSAVDDAIDTYFVKLITADQPKAV